MYRSLFSAPVPRYHADESDPVETAPMIDAPPMPTDDERQRAYAQVSWNVISDTVTLPSALMRTSMASAVCGDEGYRTDQPTLRLEDAVAQLTGKEAALFLPSGTQANQLALHVHTRPTLVPVSILCDVRSHIHTSEMGGIAYHSRATTVPVIPHNTHHLTLEDIAPFCESQDPYMPTHVHVISLENTLQGTIFPQSEIERISAFAHERGIIMHLDGARLWNAWAETGISLADLCRPFDTVSLCLSKGIGAPVGSILVGPTDTLFAVRLHRKLFGGMMRQTGVLAAAAHAALHENMPRLRQTHSLARRVAARLQDCGVTITLLFKPIWFSLMSHLRVSTARRFVNEPPLWTPLFRWGHIASSYTISLITTCLSDWLAYLLLNGPARPSQHLV